MQSHAEPSLGLVILGVLVFAALMAAFVTLLLRILSSRDHLQQAVAVPPPGRSPVSPLLPRKTPSPPAESSPRPRVTAAGQQCPACGGELPADSPHGLCGRCLLQAALKSPGSAADGSAAEGLSPAPFTAPTPEELGPHFAQLELQALLGQGGMGAVYRARQHKLDRLVALKILPAEWGRGPAFAERFAREARALARLSHPNIVGVHDFGEGGGHFYLVMEYVDGANLRQLLQDGPLQPRLALQIVAQICDALQYAHEEGIVHRDVKPENILIDRRGRVKIADFGLAKLVGSSRASFTLTGTHQVMGTLDYMAPEQRLRPQEVDHRADLYALGVVLYEMLTGELPLGRFTPPSQSSGVDDRLDAIVFRALEREPAQRYQHASEVRHDLDAISRGTAGPMGVPTPALPGEEPSEWVQLQVRGPAAGLMTTAIIAVINWCVWGLVAFFSFLPDISRAWELRGYEIELAFGLVVVILGSMVLTALTATIVTGANKLKRFTGYDHVMIAIMLAMLPWSAHCLVGIPVGIWCFIVLGRKEVSAAFAANLRKHRQVPLRPTEAYVPPPAQQTGTAGRKMQSFWAAFRTLFFSSAGARASQDARQEGR